MMRANLSIVDAYMNECTAKGGNPDNYWQYLGWKTKYDLYSYGDTTWQYEFNPYVRFGLQCLAIIFMFNPKKIDKGMIVFKKIPAEQRALANLGIDDVFYAIAEELASDPVACRQNILSWIDKYVNNGFKSFDKQDLPSALKKAVFFKRLYPGSLPNMFCDARLSACFSQFCAVLLVYSDKENTTFPIIWDDDVNRLSMRQWNSFCYIIANAKFKLNFCFKLDGYELPSTNKMAALCAATFNASRNKSVATLKELATFALFFKSRARFIVENDEQRSRNFVEVNTRSGLVRQELTPGEFETLQRIEKAGVGGLTCL